MKIKRLRVQGYKLLRDLTLDLTRGGEPRQFTVLVGRNATGKTSVLRAIALTAAGRDGAKSLAEDQLTSFFDRRVGAPSSARFEATFALPPAPTVGRRQSLWTAQDPDNPPPRDASSLCLESVLQVENNELPFKGDSWYHSGGPEAKLQSEIPFGPLSAAHNRQQPGWFVVGYGVTRQLQVRGATAGQPDRPTRVQEKLGGLFSDRSPVGLGYADDATYGIARPLVRLLRKAVTGDSQLLPLIDNLESAGKGGIRSLEQLAERDKVVFSGTKLPATYLSHGYQATLAWLADLIGQFLLDLPPDRLPTASLDDMSGLVLVDELDLFLHPEWQADFVRSLTRTFPNLQFIATTHSPLLLAGCAPEQVVVLETDAEGSVIARTLQVDPRLMTTTDLYTQVFGISAPPPGELARDFARYEYLARDPDLDPREEAELRRLRSTLDDEGVLGLSPRRTHP